MRTYFEIVGSVSFFDSTMKDLDAHGEEFNKKVEEYDRANKNAPTYEMAKSLIIRNNYYHCIVEQAHSRLGGLIEDLSTDDATIYVHNPTAALQRYLANLQDSNSIELQVISEDRSTLRDLDDINPKLETLRQKIMGQERAITEIAKSLLYLSKARREKPFVMMLYGKSGVGKTETAHALADIFFDGHLVEKHLSMFGNTVYADYLFGGKPNITSLGFDLDERRSNLVFLDEIDKCLPIFHSVFYSLFDNKVFQDATYEVDVADLVIVLTCNYQTELEIKKNLGDPIYYRIDKFIGYDDFSPTSILDITRAEIDKQLNLIDADISADELYFAASHQIAPTKENGRTIQSKVRSAIENIIFKDAKLSAKANEDKGTGRSITATEHNDRQQACEKGVAVLRKPRS